MWALTQEVETSAGVLAAGKAGSGRSLVLAHGWLWSSYSWHKLIPVLSESFEVYWYDMPGYGMSEKSPDQRTSLDVQAEVFCEMVEHWGLVNPIVVAHDFGGATTLRAHLLHGIDFNQYVLMNVVAMRPWGSEFFDHVGKHVDAFKGLPPHIHAAIVEAYIKGALVTDLGITELENLLKPWLTNDGKISFYRQFEQADEKFTAEIESFYPNIRCPVKIIWGECDPWIPLSRGEALRDLIDPVSFKSLPKIGHLPQLESPKAVLHELATFLA